MGKYVEIRKRTPERFRNIKEHQELTIEDFRFSGIIRLKGKLIYINENNSITIQQEGFPFPYKKHQGTSFPINDEQVRFYIKKKSN